MDYLNRQELVETLSRLLYGFVVSSEPNRRSYQIHESPRPTHLPQNLSELGGYIEDFLSYYESRLEFYDYMFNKTLSELKDLQDAIDEVEYARATGQYIGCEERYGVIRLAQNIQNEKIYHESFFYPEPIFSRNGVVGYPAPPQPFGFHGPLQVFRSRGEIIPDNVILLNEYLPHDDDIMLFGIVMEPAGISVYNGAIIYLYRIVDSLRVFNTVTSSIGYYITDIELSEFMTVDYGTTGFVGAELVDYAMPIPINNVVVEESHAAYESEGIYFHHLSYPVIKVLDTWPNSTIINYRNNVIVTTEERLLVKYYCEPTREDSDIGQYSDATLTHLTDGDYPIFIPHGIAALDLKNILPLAFYTETFDVELTSFDGQPLQFDLSCSDDEIPLVAAVYLTTPVGDISLFRIYMSDISAPNFDTEISEQQTPRPFIHRYESFNPFTYTVINKSVVTPVNYVAQDLLSYFDSGALTDGRLVGSINVYYATIPRRTKIRFTLYQADREPALYPGVVKALDAGTLRTYRPGTNIRHNQLKVDEVARVTGATNIPRDILRSGG